MSAQRYTVVNSVTPISAVCAFLLSAMNLPLYARIVCFVIGVLGTFYFVPRVHWTFTWRRAYQYLLAASISFGTASIAIPQFLEHGAAQFYDKLSIKVAIVSSPYPDGHLFAGLVWEQHYVDVRMSVNNEDLTVKNIDLIVDLEGANIAGIGQLYESGRARINPLGPNRGPFPEFLLQTPAESIPADRKVKISPTYRVRCPELGTKDSLQLAIASTVFPVVVRRTPKAIRIHGSYETSYGDRTFTHPVALLVQNFPPVAQ